MRFIASPFLLSLSRGELSGFALFIDESVIWVNARFPPLAGNAFWHNWSIVRIRALANLSCVLPIVPGTIM